MVAITVTDDIKKVTKKLNSVQRKQLPFAIAQSLNSIAFEARKDVRADMPKHIDRPTTFTLNAAQVKKARKTNLESVVFIEAKRWAYLQYQIDGGTRHPPRGTSVPVNVKLNKYGNIPNRRKGIIKNNRQFIATFNGIKGIWERYGKKRGQIRLVARIHQAVSYTKRLPFVAIVQDSVNKKYVAILDSNLQRALDSAK